MPRSKKKEEIDNYLREIARYPCLKSEEERELFQRMKAGEEKAKTRIIEANLRLVVSVAKEYFLLIKDYNYYISFWDLISAGNEGLLEAVERFEPTKGYKFSTYAYYWIRHKILRFLAEQGRLIRIPIRHQRIFSKIIEVSSTYFTEYGEWPSHKWIAETLNIDVSLIQKIEREFQVPFSLDSESFPKQDSKKLASFVYDEKAEDEMREVQTKTLFEKNVEQILPTALEKFFTSLNERERKILALRSFRRKREGRLTLESIGKIFGIGKERVRQIEQKLLERLRSHIELLDELLEKDMIKSSVVRENYLIEALESFQKKNGLEKEIKEVHQLLEEQNLLSKQNKAGS